MEVIVEQETTTPGRGTAESAQWFKDKLEEIGLTQSAFVRTLQRLGDDRQFQTALRSVNRMATGEARVSGEMRATLNYVAMMRSTNGRRLASLNRQLEALTSGRMRTHENRGSGDVDTTAETITQIKTWIEELEKLAPEFVAVSGEGMQQ